LALHGLLSLGKRINALSPRNKASIGREANEKNFNRKVLLIQIYDALRILLYHLFRRVNIYNRGRLINI